VILKAMAGKLKWWEAAEIIGVMDRTMRRWRKRYHDADTSTPAGGTLKIPATAAALLPWLCGGRSGRLCGIEVAVYRASVFITGRIACRGAKRIPVAAIARECYCREPHTPIPTAVWMSRRSTVLTHDPARRWMGPTGGR
jgi:hypothetical protein